MAHYYKGKKKNNPYEKPPQTEFKAYTNDDFYEEESTASHSLLEDPDEDLSPEEYAELLDKKSELLADELNTEFGNEFPVSVFPEVIRKHIMDAEDANGFPVDFYSAGILCAVSAAMRNNFRVKFKESFKESPALFMVLVGRAGTNKTHPLKKALEVIYEQEEAMYKKYMKLKEIQKEIESKTQKKEVDPVRKRYIISDTTLEAVCKLLTENPAGLLLHVDEFSGFLDSMNKYRKGDDEQKWMSIWSNVTFPKDRVSSEPQLIINPYVTPVGTIQPDLLNKMKDQNRGSSGFIDRFLFAYPNTVENKPWSTKDIDMQLEREYKDIIRVILNMPEEYDNNGRIKAIELVYSPKAMQLILEWQEYNTDLINDYLESNLISAYKKFETYIHRFALIMCVLDYASKSPHLFTKRTISKLPILPIHVENAKLLIEYFRQCARKVHAKLPQENPVNKLPKNAQLWYEHLPQEFDTRQALHVATHLNISKRMAQYYLADDALFLKIKHGVYCRKHYKTIKLV